MNFFDRGSSVWQCYGKLAKLIMTRRALILCVGVAFAASLLTTLAADKKAVDVSKIPPASDKKGVTYEADIKPIFEKSCVKCHGAEKQKGKLRLDSLAATLKGGEDGKVIEAGNSAKSMLVHNVAHVGDEDMFMPPPDNKDKIQPLTKEQVGLIRAWIDQGAK
jgi:mono/diheme cytochrome c family protein